MTSGSATDQPAQDQPQHDSSSVPLDEIRALVDERARYDGWLQALDGRRAMTPAHVLERVRQDYAGRLDRVASQLVAHIAPLRAHEESLSERHHAVEQRLSDERDGLAEIELRTLVGEFAADEGEQRRTAAQGSIGALERELGGASAALTDVRGLVARVNPATPTPTPPAPAPADAPAPEPTAPAPVSATLSGPPEVAREDTPDAGSGFEVGAPFDHEAVDAARVALGDRQPSLTPAFNDAIRTGAPGGSGMGAGRAPEPAAAGQEKTLRCQDCGALNYPTEWYCERCGGELAAL